jgi:quinol monooxygenase YgiN
MDHGVSWILELEIQPGRERDFRTLMEEMVRATQTGEPGTLTYAWNLSEDGRTCHVCERYADCAAVLTHAANFAAQFAGRFFAVLKPVRFVVYGRPNAEVQDALAAFCPTYMQPVGGFFR